MGSQLPPLNIPAVAAATLAQAAASNSPLGPNDAPILIVMGQSNAYGHGTNGTSGSWINGTYNPNPINTPLSNVLTLQSSKLFAASGSITPSMVQWTGMTSNGDVNIGANSGDAYSASLGAQNNCCNVANQFAYNWQQHINSGNALGLPNLYVVLMAIGAQGLQLGSSIDAWAPDRSTASVVSLYPRAIVTLKLVIANLRASGLRPRLLGIHWNQWEAEADAAANTSTLFAAKNSAMNFDRLIRGINDALGCPNAPWTFYQPIADGYPAVNRAKVITALNSIVAADPQNRSFMPTKSYSGYTGVAPNYGIFGSDNVHYLPVVQQYFANQEWKKVLAGNYGVSCGYYPNGSLSIADIQTTASDALTLAKSVSACNTKWSANQYPLGTVATQVQSLPGLTWAVANYQYNLDVVTEPITGKKVFMPVAVSGTANGGNLLLKINSTPTDGKYGYITWSQVGNPCVSICLMLRTASASYNSIGYGYLNLWIDSLWSGSQKYQDIGVTAAGTSHDTGTPYAMMWDLSVNAIRTFAFSGTPTAGVYKGAMAGSGTNLRAAKTLVTGWPMNTLVDWRAGLRSANNGTITVEWYDTTTSSWVVAIQQQNMNTVLNGNLASGQIGIMFGMSTVTAGVAAQNTALSGARMTNISFASDD